MEEDMSCSQQLSRTGVPADIVRRILDAVPPLDGFAARGSRRQVGRHPGGPLDAAILRDLGARREYQDYADSAAVPAGSDRRLHRIAEAALWAPQR
jgi:hypothetical protein